MIKDVRTQVDLRAALHESLQLRHRLAVIHTSS
jgi:hypothetical protein